MSNTINSTSRPRVAILAGTAVIAIAAIVYFSFFYPPTPSNEVSGTIGAVKKYRSEQITDKDVNLASQQSEAIAAETATDAQAANELAATATAFEKTYRNLEARAELDKATKIQFERTISTLQKTAEMTLARTQSPTYDKTAAQGYQKTAEQSMQNSAANQSLDRTAQATFNRAAVVELQQAIKTVDAKATEIASRPWEGRGKMTFDKSTTLDMRSKLGDLENRAKTYDKTFHASLDKQAGATMDNRSKENLENRKSVDNKAQ